MSRPPGSLILARAAAGLVLVVAGLALGATVLVVVGAALAAWALVCVVPRGG